VFPGKKQASDQINQVNQVNQGLGCRVRIGRGECRHVAGYKSASEIGLGSIRRSTRGT